MKRNDEPRKIWSQKDEAILDRLLSSAGPPEALPADLDRLRRTVTDRWQASTRRETEPRQSHWEWWAAAAALVPAILALWLFLPGSQEQESPWAMAWQSSGPVEISGSPEDGILPGTQIATGPGGRISFRLEGSRSLRLDEESRVRFASDRRVELLAGAIYSDSGDRGGPGIVVSTAFGDVHEIGTQYEVRLLADDLRVRVREGRVELSNRRGGKLQDFRIVGGEELILKADGSSQRLDHHPDDASWDWTLTTAPPLGIEGITLEALLERTAREGGWDLRFVDASAKTSAQEILLHGSIDGLGLWEGLELAMEGSGLRAQIVGSELIVEEVRTTN